MSKRAERLASPRLRSDPADALVFPIPISVSLSLRHQLLPSPKFSFVQETFICGGGGGVDDGNLIWWCALPQTRARRVPPRRGGCGCGRLE